MSPMKLSLYNPGGDAEEVEVDDDVLVGQLREVVDATPELTMQEALRQGMQHIVDTHRDGGGQQ
jgi:hypothetical protein